MFVDKGEEACQIIRENLKRTGFANNACVVRRDYLEYLNHCNDQFGIIFLDPPYAEVFLENALNRITEIDILQSGGIIIAERPFGKELTWDSEKLLRSKDYTYGKTLLTVFRKP